MNDATDPPQTSAGLLGRAGVGGILMGLANLVPGISGGTMLLAVGIYPRFIAAVAEISTLRWRPANLVFLGTVVLGVLVTVASLAGVVGGLVAEHRWVMYSLFIGLTLGGVPIVWRLLRRWDRVSVCGAVAGAAAMVALAFLDSSSAASADNDSWWLHVLAGVAGASAMILPGISGAYLLLVLGEYVVVMEAIDTLTNGVFDSDWHSVGVSMKVVVPVGIGVIVGVAGVSNLIRFLLRRFERATLGLLLGLLVGAVAGLWPYREPVSPMVGDVIRGVTLTTAEQAAEVEPAHWPTRTFRPDWGELLGALGLVGAGFAAALAIGRLGRGECDENPSGSP